MLRFAVIPATLACLSALVSGTPVAFAAPVETLSEINEISADSVVDVEALKVQITQCAVRPYSLSKKGRRIYAPSRSICDELVIDGAFARYGKAWEIRVLSAGRGEGSSLWDLVIWGRAGRKMVEMSGVPGNGNPIDVAIRALDIEGVKAVPNSEDSPAKTLD